MFIVKTAAQRLVQSTIVLTVIAILLSCNTISIFNKSRPTSQPQSLTAVVQPTIAPQTQPTRPSQSTATQSPTKKEETPTVQPTTSASGGAYETYNGEINGVKYSIEHPANFTHSSAYGWDEFCLDVHDSLCVGVHRPEGSWSDPEAMAKDVMTSFSSAVSNFNIYHQQHTVTTDGFTAYWVGCTYTLKGVNFESSRLFVVVQNVGFEIAGYGEPEMMKTYASDIKKMMESFILVYN